MPGNDIAEHWRTGLLADGHGIPVVSVRDGRVRDANRVAYESFANLRVGAAFDDVFEENSRDKIRNLLRHGASGTAVEVEVSGGEGPPVALRVLLLAAPDEQLVLGCTGGAGYTEKIGAELMAANTDLANLTRELSRRVHELESVRKELRKIADVREMFIATVAHDLRNPLNAILLSESLLHRKSASSQTGEMERHASRVQRSANQMLQLVDSLLFASHLDSSESLEGHALEVVGLDEMARETVRDVVPLANERGIRVALTADEPVHVRGHRAWLAQVLSNLLTNAIHCSPADGAVFVEVAPEGAAVRCDVVDRGPSVPPADRERIFDRFVKSGGQRGADGLGLYICRKIIELHGGEIWMENNPEGGARFAFRIPRQQVGA